MTLFQCTPFQCSPHVRTDSAPSPHTHFLGHLDLTQAGLTRGERKGRCCGQTWAGYFLKTHLSGSDRVVLLWGQEAGCRSSLLKWTARHIPNGCSKFDAGRQREEGKREAPSGRGHLKMTKRRVSVLQAAAPTCVHSAFRKGEPSLYFESCVQAARVSSGTRC